MGPDAFKDYLFSIRVKIGHLNTTVGSLVNKGHVLKKQVADMPDDFMSRASLEVVKYQQVKLRTQILDVGVK